MPSVCCCSHPEGRAAIIYRFRSAAAPVRIHASPSEPRYRRCELPPRPASPCSPMPKAAPEIHLSENEGIEGVLFAVTGDQGFVDAALCLELIRRGALETCSLNLRDSSFGFQQYLGADVPFFQGNQIFKHKKYHGGATHLLPLYKNQRGISKQSTPLLPHGRECWQPPGPPLLCLAIDAATLRPSPPRGMLSCELASSIHASLNFYKLN